MSDDDKSSEKIVSDGELKNLAEQAFKTSADAIEKAVPGQTVKILGIFDVPSEVAGFANGFYNVATDFITHHLQDHTYTIIMGAGDMLGRAIPGMKSEGMVKKVAAVGTFATNAVLKSGSYIVAAGTDIFEHQKSRTKMARRLAPVLDELKNGHSLIDFNSVSMAENEMIYAHRRRMDKQFNNKNYQNMLDVIVGSGPNVALDLKMLGQMWTTGKSPSQLHMEAPPLVTSSSNGAHDLKTLAKASLGVGAPQISEALKRASQKKLDASLQPYSALEMVLELDEQMSANPKESAYKEPRGGDSYPLEEYIMRIMIQHQKDMADLNPEHTELRAALKDDMMALAKPMAEAMREGDLAPLELVRMIGEGKIIKKHGRAIASINEVEKLIKRNETKAHKFTTVDSKEFYANASFSKEDLAKALGNLKGEEKEIFSAMFPDSILEEAGMSKEEIEQMRGHMVKRYEGHLAEVVHAVVAKSDEELKKEGLATNEIKQLRDAAATLSEKGETAIHEMKTGPESVTGPLLNLVVPQVNGNKTYFGTLLSKGQEAAKTEGEGAPEAKPEVKEEPATHAERLESRNATETEQSKAV